MHKKALMLLLMLFWVAPVFAQTPHVVSTSPVQNELNVPLSTNISVTFDVDMDQTTINDSTFVVNARSTGLHQGTITYDGPSKTATFDPVEDFDEGEVVTVALTTGIESSGGTPLDSAYLWSFTSAVDDGPGTFASDSVYAVGMSPASVISADLDGDGNLDFATANFGDNNVSVLLNNGDGTFATQSVYAVGNGPRAVFSSDLDRDGDLDLATANFGDNNVSVLLNNADGAFATHSVYAVGDGPESVFSADLDGDGDLDLAAANWTSGNISVLLNNGDGTFASDSVYPVGVNPRSVFSADLDGDGNLDLATANRHSDNISVLLNNGDGTFTLQSVYAAGGGPASVFSADLDGDRDLDLATANYDSDNVSVLLNNGDGTFGTESVYAVGTAPVSVFCADLDGDGDLDLAAANYASNNVSVLLNNGDGTFAPQSVYPVGIEPISVFSADLDGDGDLDLATANEAADNVSVLLNAVRSHVVSTSPVQNELNVPVSTNISVTFDVDMDETTINDSTFVVNARSTGLHAGTITYDGPSRTATFDPAEDFDEGEVVTVALTTGIESSGGASLQGAVWSFTSVVYDGSGTFAPQSVYPVGDYPASVFSADLDGDGDLDLAAANRFSDNVSVLPNNGDGTFGTHSVYPVGDWPFSVFSADLDGDGDLDLATANFDSNNVSVLLNNADGTFGTESVYAVGTAPVSVFCADLDGDGDLDLAAANYASNNVSVLLNNGDGTFAPHSVYPVGDWPASVFSADLDGDGDLDLAAANRHSDNVSVLLNNGNGTFVPHSVYAAGDGPFSVFSADLDGDGDLDLAAANENSDNVSVLLNNGDGTFAPHSVYPVGGWPYSVFSADLDGDGDLDLATANYDSDNVSVLLNNGDGTFATHSVYAVGDGPMSVFSADLDGDGDLDLAVPNVFSNNVSVLLNFTFREVVVTAGPDISGGARTDVPVNFYIENTGDVLDVYDVDVWDFLGWDIDPLHYEVTLDTNEVDSVSLTVSIPNVPLGVTNRIIVFATSQTDPSVWDSTSLAVICDAYGIKIAEITDVGNDQGKQVRLEWTSFPNSDPLVTDFTIFRRIDPLLFALPAYNPGFFSGKDYPPGEWDMIGTYEAFGETLYSAVVPTLKDSTVAEGMYWSAFFVRAGTDDPIVYFDSPVDSGYSIDNLSPSPPTGLFASHEPAVTKLTWAATPALDFDYYTVYRDTLEGFTPDAGNRLGYTIDTSFVDSTAQLGRTYYYLTSATDFSGNESDPSNEAIGVRYIAGDANADGAVELGDAVYVLNYLFRNGPEPSPMESGDANCDGTVKFGDVIYLINYLFRDGPPPDCP